MLLDVARAKLHQPPSPDHLQKILRGAETDILGRVEELLLLGLGVQLVGLDPGPRQAAVEDQLGQDQTLLVGLFLTLTVSLPGDGRVVASQAITAPGHEIQLRQKRAVGLAVCIVRN